MSFEGAGGAVKREDQTGLARCRIRARLCTAG